MGPYAEFGAGGGWASCLNEQRSRTLADLVDLAPADIWNVREGLLEHNPSTNSSLKRLFPAELRTEEFEGHVNALLCKLIAYNLVVSALEMRMWRIRPDFPAEVPLLEDVVRMMVEVPVLRAAWSGLFPSIIRAGFVFIVFYSIIRAKPV